jgi:quinol monooxygenase YgiN
MIVVLADVEIDPGNLEPMRQAMRAMEEASRAEPGCREYVFSQELSRPEKLRVCEIWDSMDALETHFGLPHMARFNQALRALPPRSLEIKVYELGAERALPSPGA